MTRDILAGVARTYRHQFGRVVVTAAIVFGGTAVVDVLVVRTFDGRSVSALAVGVVIAGGLTNALGTTFYPGFLDRVVGELQAGHPPEPFTKVLRTVPYGRLIVADVLVVLVTALGFLALVIPGIVAYTLLAITGPILNIEDLGPIAAMRRSVRLVRRHFWLVLVLVVLPLELEHYVTHAARHLLERADPLTVFLAHGITGMIVGSFVGVVIVNVAFALRREEQHEIATGRATRP